jgi:hypothetical protein
LFHLCFASTYKTMLLCQNWNFGYLWWNRTIYQFSTHLDIVWFRFQIQVLKGLIGVSFASIYQINLELNQTWYSSVLAWIRSRYQISDHLKVVWFKVLFGSKEVCYARQLKVHIILAQFSVLCVFLFSFLSLLAFILGSDIKKNAKGVLQSGFHAFWWDIMAKEEEDSKGELLSNREK